MTPQASDASEDSRRDTTPQMTHVLAHLDGHEVHEHAPARRDDAAPRQDWAAYTTRRVTTVDRRERDAKRGNAPLVGGVRGPAVAVRERVREVALGLDVLVLEHAQPPDVELVRHEVALREHPALVQRARLRGGDAEDGGADGRADGGAKGPTAAQSEAASEATRRKGRLTLSGGVKKRGISREVFVYVVWYSCASCVVHNDAISLECIAEAPAQRDARSRSLAVSRGLARLAGRGLDRAEQRVAEAERVELEVDLAELRHDVQRATLLRALAARRRAVVPARREPLAPSFVVDRRRSSFVAVGRRRSSSFVVRRCRSSSRASLSCVRRGADLNEPRNQQGLVREGGGGSASAEARAFDVSRRGSRLFWSTTTRRALSLLQRGRH